MSAAEGATDPDSPLGPDASWSRRVRRFRTGLLGSMAASTPCALLLGDGVPAGSSLGLLLTSVGLTVAAVRQGRGREGRWWVAAAALVGVLTLAPSLWTRPAWTFAIALVGVAVFSWSRRPLRRGGVDAADPDTLPVWGALGPCTVVVLLVALARNPPPEVLWSAFWTTVLTSLLGLQALARGPRPLSKRRVQGLWFWGLLVAAGLLAFSDPGLRGFLWLTSGLGPIFFVDSPRSPERPFGGVVETILSRPELSLAVGFGGVIAVGSVLLSVPSAIEGGSGISGIDAFFTAVSATCVTGLIVLDTPEVFTGWGEFVLLVLIQLGGLGIMSFSVAALAVLRQRPSIRHERALADVFVGWRGHPNRAVKHIFRVTFVAESLGALLLAARFFTAHGDPPGTALWRGLFTSVSAFCNAGFALQSNSLVPYQGDALITLIVSTLIYVGALGPVAVVALLSRTGRGRGLSVRLMVQVSALLSLVGTALFLAFEFRGVLAGLSWGDRVHNAVLQSITLRTAGFNSVEMGDLRPETQVFMLLWMFIGGGPGSTAGGIKTTTFAVILMSVASTLRARPEVTYRSRRINHGTFYRATAILALGLASVAALWMALLLTQTIEPLAALFESVSALATVGLSVGATQELDEVGKCLIALGMFAGRLGPVTVLYLFAADRRPPKWRYPETGFPVG